MLLGTKDGITGQTLEYFEDIIPKEWPFNKALLLLGGSTNANDDFGI